MSQDLQNEEQADDVPVSQLGFPVVGLGASAGGLEVLVKLLESLPATPGMAFVVITHLSPHHPSNIAEILQKSTKMRVAQVNEAVHIERDHVYVIAPTQNLLMHDGVLNVSEARKVRGRPAVIDTFFRTLAKAHRERGIAIVLSGTGSDGSVGIAEIKAEGGIVIAQSPEDAEFGEMPRNAIGTGKVDLVLPAAEMGAKLLELWHNMQRIQLPPAEPAEAVPAVVDSASSDEAALSEIMATLRMRTGHDFKHYKRATVLRRIERRLQVNSLSSLPAYREYLEANVEETEPLLGDMLIGVTNFFRDRSAFESLERLVIPQLFNEQLQDDQLRAWVAGCSSGEEAYSLAMLMTQEAATNAYPRSIQIFATDIDAKAIARGREGRYPETVAADLPPLFVRRYMAKEGDSYLVNKALRERVLFAQHNLLRDPPFSRLDLVSCRNLLIYLDRGVQREILQMFHFSLRPNGFLFLGSSETADAAPGLFTALDKRNRIYQANPAVRALRSLPHFPLGGNAPRRHVAEAVQGQSPSLDIGTLHRAALVEHALPSLLVNAEGEIVHSLGADRYLRYAPGVPTQSLLTLVQPELRAALRTALFQTGQTGTGVSVRAGRLLRDGVHVDVTVSVQPVQQPPGWAGQLTLIVFSEVVEASPATPSSPEQQNPLVEQLEAELQQKDALLQKTISQYETALQDLKASNEELQAINEELRSTTEELETSKEELQSTNEELITVNHELKMKVDETSEINDDLQNLISSTDIATVFVDRDMRIKRFTDPAASLFNIIAADVGRSLLDITHRLDYPELADDVRATFSSLRTVEREITSNDGRWLLARLLPYRTGEDRIDGAVLTFVDITCRRSAEQSLQLGEERMHLIASSMPDFAIMTLDELGLFTSWSLGAERVFGYTEAEILGKPADLIFTDEDRRDGVPQREMRQARERGRAVDERWHRRKDGSTVFVSGIMAPMRLGRLKGYAKIARDMTAKRHEESSRSAALDSAVQNAATAAAANQAKDEFLAIMSHELKHPLNLIQLNAQLLLALPEAQREGPVAKIGKTIQRTVRSQARIIDDLLDISRTQSGKLVLAARHMNLADGLQSSVAWASKLAADKGIDFHVALPDEPLFVQADPTRIEQIALNLLSNAIKFTPPGGHISVKLRRYEDEAVLEIADTGRGIDAAFLPQVFDLFKQAEPHESRSEGGLGIGLALVRDLVHLHGGTVRVNSPGLGRGATFTVFLPLRENSDFGHLAPPANGAALEGLRILYVDDTLDTLEIFKSLLELEGATVLTASSGKEALEVAQSNSLDLVLSDIGMPVMDGYQFIEALRAMPAMAKVPAVALTGYGRAQDAERALQSGFNAHLSKPVEMHKLRNLVERLQLRKPS
jgi:two-component system CheB/CheR fusion protein